MRWKIISISYAVVAPVSDFSENCLQLDKGWQTPNHYHLAKKTVYLCHNWWQLCKRKTMHHQLVYCQQCKKCGPSAVVHGLLNVLFERQKAIIPWVNDLSPLLTYHHLSCTDTSFWKDVSLSSFDALTSLILQHTSGLLSYWYFLLEGLQLQHLLCFKNFKALI